MTRSRCLGFAAGLFVLLIASIADAEILAMLNYESKADNPVRREGIAIIDVDPVSPTFGNWVMDIPLPPDLVAHHIYFNRDKNKAYVTALGKSILHVIDLKRFPYRVTAIEIPDCQVLEDVAFSENKKHWFLTCMGSSNVIMGDAKTDKPLKTIAAPDSGNPFISHPHGVAVDGKIDRVLVTSTIKPGDINEAGDTVTVIEAKSGNVL